MYFNVHIYPAFYSTKPESMKTYFNKLLKNRLFLLLINGVINYIAFSAVVMATLNVPPEAILDSNLRQVVLVFEEYP